MKSFLLMQSLKPQSDEQEKEYKRYSLTFWITQIQYLVYKLNEIRDENLMKQLTMYNQSYSQLTCLLEASFDPSNDHSS